MKTTENNKLIAEFMGFQKTEIGWYDSREIMLPLQLDGNTYEDCELAFERSWDWLMPVIEECRQHQLFGSQRLINNIDERLMKLDLMATYRNIIDFIEWYNKNN